MLSIITEGGERRTFRSRFLFFRGLYYVTFEDQTESLPTQPRKRATVGMPSAPWNSSAPGNLCPHHQHCTVDPTEYVMAVTSTLPVSADPYQVTVNAVGEHRNPISATNASTAPGSWTMTVIISICIHLSERLGTSCRPTDSIIPMRMAI